MKPMRNRTNTVLGIVAALVLVAALASAGILWAQAPNRAARAGAIGFGFGPLRMLNYAARQMNLTDAQVQQIKDIVRSHRGEIKGVVDDAFAARDVLRQAIAVGDNAAIADAVKRLSAVELTGAQLNAQLRAQILNNVLTPDQRTKAADLERQLNQKVDGVRQRIDQFLDSM